MNRGDGNEIWINQQIPEPSDTLNPDEYNNCIISLLFAVEEELINLITSSFERTSGIFFSDFGRLMPDVGSLLNRAVYANLIEDKKRIVEIIRFAK